MIPWRKLESVFNSLVIFNVFNVCGVQIRGGLRQTKHLKVIENDREFTRFSREWWIGVYKEPQPILPTYYYYMLVVRRRKLLMPNFVMVPFHEDHQRATSTLK